MSRSDTDPPTKSEAMTRLHDRFRRIGHLNHAVAMLTWDESVIMPVGGGETRAETLATLKGMIHEMTAAAEIGELVEAAAANAADPWQAANVERIRRAWRRANAVPGDLEMALSKACSACEQAWRPARGKNDWAAVRAKLERVFALTRERAAAWADGLGGEPYDALLDGYEPGLARADIDPIFAQLAQALPPLIERALDTQRAAAPVSGPFPADRQASFGRALMANIGFDFQRGRLDTSYHPFCGGEPDDTRITTRYNEADFLESMFAVLHEAGHALYEQGLPKAWRGQPVGQTGGMALHESQSLTWEMQVGRSPAFLRFATPLIQRELLGGETRAAEWQADNLSRHATKVERGFVRVDADELTYPLHVILRYEMEMELVAGRLAVADLPDAWDAAMKKHLGLSTGGDHRNGVMQDMHWFAGYIGYFPCYTLGAVIAAQLQRAAAAALGDPADAIERGDFSPLLRWQRQHVHERGRLEPTKRVIAEASGAPLDVAAYLTHLRARYAP